MAHFHSIPEPSKVPLQPLCPQCGLPMWLVDIEHPKPGDLTKDKLHFECQVCNAKAVLAPLS